MSAYSKLKERRHELIQKVRVFPYESFETEIEAYSADDLTWMLERIDEQNEPLKRQNMSVGDFDRIAQNLHHCRSVVAQVFQHKFDLTRHSEAKRSRFRSNTAILISLGSLAVALTALAWTVLHTKPS